MVRALRIGNAGPDATRPARQIPRGNAVPQVEAAHFMIVVSEGPTALSAVTASRMVITVVRRCNATLPPGSGSPVTGLPRLWRPDRLDRGVVGWSRGWRY